MHKGTKKNLHMSLHLQPYLDHTLVPQPSTCRPPNGPDMLLDHHLLYISFHASSPTAMVESRTTTTIHGAKHTKKMKTQNNQVPFRLKRL